MNKRAFFSICNAWLDGTPGVVLRIVNNTFSVRLADGDRPSARHRDLYRPALTFLAEDNRRNLEEAEHRFTRWLAEAMADRVLHRAPQAAAAPLAALGTPLVDRHGVKPLVWQNAEANGDVSAHVGDRRMAILSLGSNNILFGKVCIGSPGRWTQIPPDTGLLEAKGIVTRAYVEAVHSLLHGDALVTAAPSVMLRDIDLEQPPTYRARHDKI